MPELIGFALCKAKFTSVRLEADEKTCPILRFGVSFEGFAIEGLGFRV